MPRFRRRPPVLHDEDAGPVPDDVPKRGLFSEPIRVVALDAREPELLEDGRVRVSFRAVVKDADGRRCPDLAVDARIVGPLRTAEGTGTTDLMGAIRFRMTGPPGRYAIEILDVAAGGLGLDRASSILEAVTEAGPPGHDAAG